MKDSKCTQRFSVCRDILAALVEYLKKRPFEEVHGFINMLQNDPQPIDPDTGKVMEPPKLIVDEKKQGTPAKE